MGHFEMVVLNFNQYAIAVAVSTEKDAGFLNPALSKDGC